MWKLKVHFQLERAIEYIIHFIFQDIMRAFYKRTKNSPLNLPSVLVFALRMGLSKHDDLNCIDKIHIISFPMTASNSALAGSLGKTNEYLMEKSKKQPQKQFCLETLNPSLLWIIFVIVKYKIHRGFIYFWMGL